MRGAIEIGHITLNLNEYVAQPIKLGFFYNLSLSNLISIVFPRTTKIIYIYDICK